MTIVLIGRAPCDQHPERLRVESQLAEHLAASWVRAGDYLLESTSVEADFVIGNPPYVRLEDIPEETAALIQDHLSYYARTGGFVRGVF